MTRRPLKFRTVLSLLWCVASPCFAPGCARHAPDPAKRIPRVTLSDDELAEPPLSVASVEELRRYVVPFPPEPGGRFRAVPPGRRVTLEGRAIAGYKRPNELIVPWTADADWAHAVHMGGLLNDALDGRRIRVRMTLREGQAEYDPDDHRMIARSGPRTAATRPYRHRYLYLYPELDAVLVGVWDGQAWQPRREWLDPALAAQYHARLSANGE